MHRTFKEQRMRSLDTSKAHKAKPSTSTFSSPKPYPVSIRAYRKKDYEYLMKFPRAIHFSLRRSLGDTEHSLAQRDGEILSSSCSVTTSSTNLGTSSSFARSVGDELDLDRSIYVTNTQASTDSACEFISFPIPPMEAKSERLEEVSEVEEGNEMDDAGDLVAPMEVKFAQAEAPQNLSRKSRPKWGHTMWNGFCKAFVAG